jgi:hypothetical protein
VIGIGERHDADNGVAMHGHDRFTLRESGARDVGTLVGGHESHSGSRQWRVRLVQHRGNDVNVVAWQQISEGQFVDGPLPDHVGSIWPSVL